MRGLSLLFFPVFAFSTEVTVDWKANSKKLKDEYFGHNTVFVRNGLGLWDENKKEIKPKLDQLVRDLDPGVLRFPGGTRAMLYRFWETIGNTQNRKPQCDPFSSEFDGTQYGVDEFFKWANTLNSKVSLVTPWAFSTPQEVASFVAYINGQVGDNRYIAGNEDAQDKNYRRWGKISDWAKRRSSNGRAVPYELTYVEISNEPFLDLKVEKKIDNPCWCDPRFPMDTCPKDFKSNWQSNLKDGFYETGIEDYVSSVKESSKLIRRINPNIKIGAAAKMKIFEPMESNNNILDAVGAVDKRQKTKLAWNRSLYNLAKESFDFFALHPYRILPVARLSLPQDLENVIKQFQEEFPDKKLAVTEFGFFKKGDTLANALVSAEMIKIAVEYDLEMLLRHVLIEDQADSLFASHGAILGAEHKKTPAYWAIKMMRDLLHTEAQIPKVDDSDLKVMLTQNSAGEDISLLVINKSSRAKSIRMPLPAGQKYRASLNFLDYDRRIRDVDNITDVWLNSRSLGTQSNYLTLSLQAYDLGVVQLKRI